MFSQESLSSFPECINNRSLYDGDVAIIYLTLYSVRDSCTLCLALVGEDSGLVAAAHRPEHHPAPGLTALTAPLVHRPHLMS